MLDDRLNWNDLRYFLEVARKGRLLGAAKRLGVNHSTVARRIAALEHALEVRLFERTDNGFHLTQAGEALLPLARQIENATDLAQQQVQTGAHAVTGTLRVGTPDGFGNAFLAGHIASFMEANPNLTIELVPVPLSHNLMKREVDLSISLEESKRQNISCSKITDYKLFLYSSKEYIESRAIDIYNLDAILQETFADYIAEILYTKQLNFNRLINSQITSQFQSSTVLAQHEFVASGGGFGVLPHFMAWKDHRLVPVQTERICFVRSYWLLVPHELQRLASVRRLQDFVMSIAAEHRGIFMPGTVGATGDDALPLPRAATGSGPA